MEKIRFGIIGCAGIARKAFLPALAATPTAKLIAVASRSQAKAERFAGQFECEPVVGYDALLARTDIDAVYIATPIGLHAEWAIAAAQAGKHVLCEKTLAPSLEQTQRILDACAEHDVALLEAYVYQFHPQHEVVRQIVEDGQIGRPVLFQAWFGFPPLDATNHRYDAALGGGALLDVGTYTIHSARRFFGHEPANVNAVLSRDGKEVDTHGSVLLDFGGGQTAQLAFGFENMYRNSYSIWGTEGTVTLTRAFSAPPDFSCTVIVERQGYRDERRLEPYDQFRGEIEGFVTGLQDRGQREIWRSDAFGQCCAVQAVRNAATQRSCRNEAASGHPEP